MKIWRGTSTLDGFIDDLQFSESKSEAELLLIGGKPIDLNEFPKLRGIFKTGVGTDNLPFELARQRDIDIRTIGSEASSIVFDETANYAAHLILCCLLRDLGEWQTWSKRARRGLAANHVLVVGHGNIGRRTADRLRAFCQVSTYDVTQNAAAELPALLRQTDCISLHLPLTSQTRDFMDAEKLSWMKDGAAIVNTARGGIISELALYEELRQGRLFAALDVFWNEPYSGLLTELPLDRWIRSPHVASTCDDWLQAAARDLREMIAELESRS